MLPLYTAALLALLFINGGAMGSKLPILEAMRSDPIPEDNSLVPDSRLNVVAQRQEWVKLQSVPPPTIHQLPGTPLELECQAMGSPAPTVRWMRDNIPIPEEEEYENNEISDASPNELARTISRLVINNVFPGEKSTYTCIAQAGIKTAYSTTLVYSSKGNSIKEQGYFMTNNEVLPTPSKPRIVLFYTVIMDTVGSSITIKCKTVGNPRPEVYWLDNEDNIISKQDSRRKVLRSGELLIQGLRWSDMGGYTCVAINPYAKDTSSTFVYPMMKDN